MTLYTNQKMNDLNIYQDIPTSTHDENKKIKEKR